MCLGMGVAKNGVMTEMNGKAKAVNCLEFMALVCVWRNITVLYKYTSNGTGSAMAANDAQHNGNANSITQYIQVTISSHATCIIHR